LEKKMEQEDATTREKILESAVKLLFTTPSEELTTRRIAREAGVNIAAINYHFRSKNELIDKAVEAATATAFEKGMAVLFAPGKAPFERLRDFLAGYAYGLVKFPGFTRTAFFAFLLKEEGATFYGRYMKEMFVKIRQVIAETEGGNSAQESGSTALMALSCVIFPFLASSTLRDAGAADYTDDEARTRYIDTMLATLVGARREENHNG
jgi:AcrR family transcriptional regulator